MTSKIYHTKHIIDLTLKNSDYIAEKVSPKKTLSVVSTCKKENYKINSLNLSNKLNFFNMNKNKNHYFLHTNFWLRFILNHKNKKNLSKQTNQTNTNKSNSTYLTVLC